MSAAELLARLADEGARLGVRDGRLRYHGPARVLTPEFRALVDEHRAQLLGLLGQTMPQGEQPGHALVRGDARRIPLLDGAVHSIVTSPPYFGQRDYGVPGQLGREETPQEYVGAMVVAAREMRRVLRDDGNLWLVLGDTYRGKSLLGIPWRVALALAADGWHLRSDIIWSKSNPMPESVRDRPTKAHEYVFLFSKRVTYYCDAEAISEAAVCNRVRGPASHRCKDTNGNDGLSRRAITGRRNKRTVWVVATQAYCGAHFATFPEKLVEPCILAGCPEGGIVLDPFVGSGTTVLVAIRHGRRAVGIDLNPEYLREARERVQDGRGQP